MDHFKDMEVSSLLLFVRAGNDMAFEELAKRYSPLINKVVSEVDIPKMRYDEATSEAYLALYRAAVSYDIENNGVTFGLYAKICITRKLSDFIGRENREEARLLELDKFSLHTGAGAESGIILKENTKRYLRLARTFLSDYEYSVFRLYLCGMTTKEIAEELDVSPKSVDNAKNRMMKHLREHSSLFFD